jgi:hypothetical protein
MRQKGFPGSGSHDDRSAASLRESDREAGKLGGWCVPNEILALETGDLDDDSVWVRRRVYKGDIDEPKTKRPVRDDSRTASASIDWPRY